MNDTNDEMQEVVAYGYLRPKRHLKAYAITKAIPSPIGVGDFRTWGQKGWPERVECGAHHNTRHPI